MSQCYSRKVVMLTMFLALILASGATWAQDVPLYRTFETSVTNNNSYGNRFADVNLDVTYTHPGTGKTVNFYGFFDGDGNGGGNAGSGNVWKMRFFPDELGTWNYTYTWSDSTSGGSGSFNCVAAGAGKGIVKPYGPNPGWFAYNGTDPVFLKSYYVKPHHVMTQDINQVGPKAYQKLVDRGYNHLQMAGLLPVSYKHQKLEDCGPHIDAYLYSSGAPSSTMRLDIWNEMDKHMKWLADHDVSLHFFEGFDGKEQGPRWSSLSWNEKNFYVKYVVSRMAPLGNVAGFNFTYETYDSTHERELVDLLDTYDPWDHLRTYMQGTYNPGDFNNGWWDYHNYLFIATEVVSPDRRGYLQSEWEVHEHMLAAWNRYDKPVYHSECWGMWRSCYDADNASVRRTAWANAFTGAMACWNDMQYCEEGNTAAQIFEFVEGALAVDVVADTMNNEIEFWKMSPHTNTTNNAIALHEPGRQYAAYRKDGGSFDMYMDAGNYDGKWINGRDGTQISMGSVSHGGGMRNFNSPFGGIDTVVVLVDLDPCVPVALNAIASSTSQIDLTWTMNAECTEVGIRVERSEGAGFTEIVSLPADSESYSDTGLATNSTHTYRVRSDKGGGEFSEYSNEVTESTQPLPPEAPSGLLATARAAELAIDLSWTDNSSGESGESNFIVERKSQEEPVYAQIATPGANSTSHADLGLASYTTYTYRVRASNGAGQSDNSNEASATTPCIAGTIFVDDADPQVTYTGVWTAQTGWAGRYMETIHESESGSSTASLSFSSGSIDIYADTRSWGGTASVTVDGAPVGTVDFSGADADSVLVATFSGLGAGSHNLVMTVDGTGWCYLDYFQYTATCGPETENAPAAPSNLTATADSASQISLSWLDNSGDNLDEEINFRVERKAAGEVDFVEVASVSGVSGTGNTIQYSDGGLDYLTEYCYRVRAYNQVDAADMFSSYTDPPVCETTLDPSGPNPPSNLAAALDVDRITLTWDANTETDPAVLYYKLHRSTTSGGPYTVVAIAFGGTNLVDSQIYPETQYYYCVSAVNTLASESGLSTEATPIIPPPPPTESQVLSATGGVSQITLNWTDTNDNEDGFKIERKLSTDTTFLPLATVGLVSQYIDAGLPEDTTYDYRIYAYNLGGDGPMSNVASATTESCVPTDETIDDADGLISYSGSWNAQSGWAGRYMQTIHETETVGAYAEMTFTGDSVELIADTISWGGNADVLIDSVLDTTISFSGTEAYQQVVYSKTDLGNGEHTIRLVCQGGGWTYLDAIHYFGCPVPPTPPAAPTNLTATATGCTQISLSWSDNATNELGYKVERDDGAGFAEIAVTGESVSSLLDSGLTELTSYTYRVRAYNALFDSAYSNEASDTTTECGGQPQFQTISWGSGSGTISEVEGGYDMTFAGIEIGAHASSDECFFAYQAITGDFDVSLQVAHQSWPESVYEGFWAKAGIMARWELTPTSKFVLACSRGFDNGDDPPLGMFEWRWVDGGTVPGGQAEAHSVFTSPPAIIPNYWQRLVRTGSDFYGYVSPDGVNWQLVKHCYSEFAGQTIPSTLYVGLTGVSKSPVDFIEFNARNLSGFNP